LKKRRTNAGIEKFWEGGDSIREVIGQAWERLILCLERGGGLIIEDREQLSFAEEERKQRQTPGERSTIPSLSNKGKEGNLALDMEGKTE